jgi:2'-5' RNA ligase
MSESGAGTERVFFALWPPTELARRMSAIADELAVSGRRMPPENLHITLAFIGDVAPERLRLLEAIGDQLPKHPLTLTLDRTGHWRRPGITWVGPSEPPAAAAELHQVLQTALAEAEFPSAQRPFKPHVTLARKSRPPRQKAIEPLTWRVTRLALVASRRSKQGAHYEIHREWSLPVNASSGV